VDFAPGNGHLMGVEGDSPETHASVLPVGSGQYGRPHSPSFVGRGREKFLA